MRKEATAAVIAILVVESLGIGYLAVDSGSQTETTTSTLTATTTSTITKTVENVATTSGVDSSRSIVLGNATSSSVSTDGIQLTTSINATGVSSGEGLAVTLSISNTLPTANNVSTSNDWAFQGVPVALWPVCYFSVPAEVAVLDGNYSANELPLLAGAKFQYGCAEGGPINQVIFQPNSDEANLTGYICSLSCYTGPLGPYELSLNFTAHGYWDVQYLANSLNVPIIGELPPSQPYSLPFVPGVYTVAVGDEWGQVDVLHFQVVAKSYAPSVVLESFLLCTSNCYYPAPFLTGTVYFNSTAPVRNFDLTVNGTNVNAGPGPIGEGYPITATNVPFVFKETLEYPVVAGDNYVISIEFYFNDTTSATATTIVVAR
jgi:hypothetical protein